MENNAPNAHDRFAGHVHDHASRIIGQFDIKAQILLGLAIGGMVFVIRELDALAAVAAFKAIAFNQQAAAPLSTGIAFVSLLCFGASGFFTFEVIRPSLNKAEKGGLIYFKSVLTHKDSRQYISAVSTAKEDQLTEAILADTYALSRVAKKKVWNADVATFIFLLAVVLLVAATVFSEIGL